MLLLEERAFASSLLFSSPAWQWPYSPSAAVGKKMWLPKMHSSPVRVSLPRHTPLPSGPSRPGSSHVPEHLPSQLWGVPCSSAVPMAVLWFYLYLQHSPAVLFFPVSIVKYTGHLVRSRQTPSLHSCQQPSDSVPLPQWDVSRCLH